jgi:hypothetical protein
MLRNVEKRNEPEIAMDVEATNSTINKYKLTNGIHAERDIKMVIRHKFFSTSCE